MDEYLLIYRYVRQTDSRSRLSSYCSLRVVEGRESDLHASADTNP